ncbi:Nuclear Pore complex Protein [Caenorhabditis elegans]|uniref:Nuclear Pore complex Protein n=1 Tax=Caenorhabditis elegans TaxID=6239 RepID=Q21021_CAEEL|nr:Nuclear Pore complex Protein [Caenorhabditis elegans]CAA84330.1 Nuclear Pore complex Protein [Caenorhabditis elegans]|eukprot:NP_497703.1 Nuclear Pore complex Protein [Caenorhabditis elegans]
MSDQKPNMGRIVASVVDVQQLMTMQFDSLIKSMDSLKIEHQTGVTQLRDDIRRSEDRFQKQLSDLSTNHGKELERLHQIIHTLLARDANPLGSMIPPQQLQQQQQMLILQRQMEMAHVQAAQAQAHAHAQAQAQAQAQSQVMANLLNAAKPAIPVTQPLVATTAQAKSTVPASGVIAPKTSPPEVVIPPAKPTFSTPTPAVVPKPATTGFSFGGTNPATSIFGKKPETASPVVVPAAKDDEDEEHDEDYEPEGEFKPVIPLPDLVEVKTGEEGEQTMFCNRSKLYIYANETKEWKERGTGELKVLYNKDKKSWRVVMRRDQVLKVCANFPILGSMTIQQMKSNEKAYTWFCEDFSEDQPAHVKLSARFANVDIAGEFKTLFEKAVAEAKSSSNAGKTIDKEIKPAAEVKKEVKQEVVIPSNNKPEETGFGDQFKPKPGSWECPGCYVTCKADEIECACCGTSKDGSVKEKNIFSKPSILQPAPGTPKVTFGFGASAPAKEPLAQTSQFGGSLSGSPSTSSSIFGGGTPKGTSVFGGGAANTPTFSFNKPAAAVNATTPSFNFNNPAASTASPATSTTPGNSLFGGGLSKTESTASSTTTPSFMFAKNSESAFPKPTFSFGKQQTPSTTAPAKQEENKQSETPKSVFGSGFTSGGATFAALSANSAKSGSIFDAANVKKAQEELAAQKKASIFGSKNTTLNTTSATSHDGDETNEDGDGEYEPEVEFKPVIPLPDLVEVKTGEEDEEVMFSARCKLYKYYSDLKENKERGLGDIKLLKSNDNKYRIVMRREQVHKLCANFRIEKSMKLSPKPNLPNVLTFMCQDFSEDASNADPAIFTAKFKDEATAGAFKTAVQDAQSKM